jgi:pyrroloquinoline-quinone synthase
MHNESNNLLERWAHWIEPHWIASLDGTPFLFRCRAGIATAAELETFVVQQYFYARHFTRYLCALLSNVVNENDRLQLTENLVDEIGLGHEKGVPHSVLYRRMLKNLGVDPSRHTILPETQGLINTMLESCRNPNLAIGLGALCLGGEAIVPHIYSQIVRGFEASGQTRETLEFFYIHIVCDDAHSDTMRAVMERELKTDEQRTSLRCAAARVIMARARFFGALTSVDVAVGNTMRNGGRTYAQL